MSVVAVCATPKDSVKLPVVAAGEEVIIINLGDTYVEVFPTETHAIDTLAINEPTIVMPNGSITLRGLDATTWKTTSPQSNGWQDLEMQITGAATGAGTPTSTAFGPSGNIQQIAFGINDSVYLAGHVPHDIKPGSKMYFHVHWSTNGVDVSSVKWQINWTGAAGHNQANFPADITLTLEEAAHGTAWRHMITEDVVGTDALEIDSLFFIELKRISNGGTDNADNVFGLFVDLHYESVQHATPNRSPDFYT
jgi:hypothetical protein